MMTNVKFVRLLATLLLAISATSLALPQINHGAEVGSDDGARGNNASVGQASRRANLEINGIPPKPEVSATKAAPVHPHVAQVNAREEPEAFVIERRYVQLDPPVHANVPSTQNVPRDDPQSQSSAAAHDDASPDDTKVGSTNEASDNSAHVGSPIPRQVGEIPPSPQVGTDNGIHNVTINLNPQFGLRDQIASEGEKLGKSASKNVAREVEVNASPAPQEVHEPANLKSAKPTEAAPEEDARTVKVGVSPPSPRGVQVQAEKPSENTKPEPHIAVEKGDKEVPPNGADIQARQMRNADYGSGAGPSVPPASAASTQDAQAQDANPPPPAHTQADKDESGAAGSDSSDEDGSGKSRRGLESKGIPDPDVDYAHAGNM